jgi:hypothetical protein
MSHPTDDLMLHARKTLLRARYLPRGPMKFWLRHIGGIYHLLAKQGAGDNIAFLDDARAARAAQRRPMRPSGAPTGTCPPR